VAVALEKIAAVEVLYTKPGRRFMLCSRDVSSGTATACSVSIQIRSGGSELNGQVDKTA
jgi:hypothetical protein